jgi:Ca2+-binding RTX toxin-like protein
MPNIASFNQTVNGTAENDIIVVEESDSDAGGNTVNAGDGNDVVIGDHDYVFQDSGAGNATIATAINIDAGSHWSTQPNMDIFDASVPYTTVLGTGAGELDLFAVTVGAGQTITLDLDYGEGMPGGTGTDYLIRLFDANGVEIASNDDSLGSLDPGGSANFDADSTRDPFLSQTLATGGTYYIQVEQYFENPVATDNRYLLNVSVTGHANTNVADPDADTLNGEAGDDLLQGGDGNDTLYGGAGSDTLYGGDGGNVYIDEEDGADDFFYGGTSQDDYAVAANSGHLTIVDAGGTGSIQALLSSAGWTINAQTGTGSSTGSTLSFTGGIFNGIYGSSFDDVITGATNIASSLVGGDGNDMITGGKLNDFIRGGAGNDVMNGGTGIDIASYDNALSAVTVSLAITTQQDTQGDGLDTLTNFENLIGSAFNDTLTGSSGANRIEGGDGDDLIEGLGGNDTLIGGGNTVVVDTISGDTLSYEHAGARVVVSLAIAAAQNTLGAGIDTVSEFENVKGSAFNDTLTGDDGANGLLGLAGDDILIGGLGDDILDGGAGLDIASYATAASGVVVNLTLLGVFQSTFGAGDDALINIEGLTGSNFNDTLIGNGGNNSLSGGLGNDFLSGDLGNDFIDGGSGADTLDYSGVGAAVTVNLISTTTQNTIGGGIDTIRNVENVTGTAFADTLTGSAFANIFTGNDGNDLLVGGLGNDTLDGGNGIDTASYASATGLVKVSLLNAGFQSTISAGTDKLIGIENLTGSAYDDTLTGDGGNNVLTGNAGNDTLLGGLGDDTLTGGAGTDTTSYAGLAAVSVNLSLAAAQNSGGGGMDTLSSIENVTGSSFDDILTGSAQINLILGGNGNDLIDGGSSNDTIDGGNNNDTLKGSGGDDTLTGGAGLDSLTGGGNADTLTGGAGIDSFFFLALGDSTLASADRITDFASGDKIDVSAIDADSTTGGNQAFHSVAAFTHHGGEYTIAYNGGTNTTTALFDTNGDANADMAILFTGNVTALTGTWVL